MKNKVFLIVTTVIFALSSLLFVSTQKAEAQTPCTINSFYASPDRVIEGSSTMLNWTTTGCTYVQIAGGTSKGTEYRMANSVLATGPLSGTTTYALYAYNGSIATTKTVTVYVTGGAYPYNYACSDSVDNDGNGLTDYPNDPGCSGPYDNEESGFAGATTLSVLTTTATNVGSTTARLHGVVSNANGPFVTYFEYGPTPQLGSATTFKNNQATSTVSFYDTVYVVPNATYYYRAVARLGTQTVIGGINTFTTPSDSSVHVVYVGGSSNDTSGSSSSSDTKPAAVTVTVTNDNDKVFTGDTVNYTVTYTNSTKQTLTNASLQIVVPQGFIIKQTTQGATLSQTTVTANIGTIASGQTGSVFVVATVGDNAAIGDTLVTNATLTYTLPSGLHDSAVGFVLNHVSRQNVIAGFALGSGFFPSTIFGWLITVIIILTIILISRRITRAKHATHGHGDHGHGGGHAAPKH